MLSGCASQEELTAEKERADGLEQRVKSLEARLTALEAAPKKQATGAQDEAAARKLRKINSSVEIEAVVADANPGNVESFCEGADLLLDGTDNFETRFLINDVSCKLDIPWIYGACIAAEGMLMPEIIVGLKTRLEGWENAFEAMHSGKVIKSVLTPAD